VTLSANATRLYAMGFRAAVKRSTLADANESRDWRIWADLAALLMVKARKLYAHESIGLELSHTVYALDSTLIDLCLNLFQWATYRSTKAAVKVHTLLDLRGSIPTFVHISNGRLHDINVLDMLTFEAGAFYVMDRGYIDFKRLFALHQSGAFFVTRAKRDLNARRVYSTACDRAAGIICDQRVMLNERDSRKHYPEHLRRISYRDPKTRKSLVFLTNNTALPALSIATLYKNRWQVELFFKWIKQHLRIRRFLGNSENAVKTQIWCAIATYVLIAIARKQLQVDTSMYTCLQILSVSVFEKTPLSSALRADPMFDKSADSSNQLILFNI
jgi:Transposase DDE domain